MSRKPDKSKGKTRKKKREPGGTKSRTPAARKPAAAVAAAARPTIRTTAPVAASNGSAMIVRRNSNPLRTRSSPVTDGRSSMAERIDSMGPSHVVAAATAGAVSSALAVAAVGQGWVGPKTSAGILLGAGAATTAYGWHAEHDHVMMAGAGITAAGAVSLANQLAVDGYESIEKRAAERKARKAAEDEVKDKATKLAAARALLAEEEKTKRNARRIVILDQDGEPLDFAQREVGGDEYHENQGNANDDNQAAA